MTNTPTEPSSSNPVTPVTEPQETGVVAPSTGTQPDPLQTGKQVTKKDRSAEGRINELIAQTKQLSGKLESMEKNTAPPLAPKEPPAPQVVRAIDQLKGMGFVHKDELDNRVRSLENQMVISAEHSRLMDTYGGSDGRPKYDPTDVEKYMREKDIYQPEIAYKAMHEAELLDWNIKQSSTTQTQKTYTAPPTSPGGRGSQVITRDKIKEMQSSPEWRSWYEKNREKILTLMAERKL